MGEKDGFFGIFNILMGSIGKMGKRVKKDTGSE